MRGPDRGWPDNDDKNPSPNERDSETLARRVLYGKVVALIGKRLGNPPREYGERAYPGSLWVRTVKRGSYTDRAMPQVRRDVKTDVLVAEVEGEKGKETILSIQRVTHANYQGRPFSPTLGERLYTHDSEAI